jgi:hypothetical protein
MSFTSGLLVLLCLVLTMRWQSVKKAKVAVPEA